MNEPSASSSANTPVWSHHKPSSNIHQPSAIMPRNDLSTQGGHLPLSTSGAHLPLSTSGAEAPRVHSAPHTRPGSAPNAPRGRFANVAALQEAAAHPSSDKVSWYVPCCTHVCIRFAYSVYIEHNLKHNGMRCLSITRMGATSVGGPRTNMGVGPRRGIAMKVQPRNETRRSWGRFD